MPIGKPGDTILLRAGIESITAEAATTSGKITRGDKVIPALRKATRSDNWTIRAGAATALAAAQQGFRVALLERSEPSMAWPADSHDLRVSALTRASQRILQNLGVWQDWALGDGLYASLRYRF